MKGKTSICGSVSHQLSYVKGMWFLYALTLLYLVCNIHMGPKFLNIRFSMFVQAYQKRIIVYGFFESRSGLSERYFFNIWFIDMISPFSQKIKIFSKHNPLKSDWLEISREITLMSINFARQMESNNPVIVTAMPIWKFHILNSTDIIALKSH